MRFHPGTILASPDAQAIFESGEIDPQELLRHHVLGEWDEAMEEDLIEASEKAIRDGGMVVSTWQVSGYTIWIRTDASRETTIIDVPLDS